MKKIIVCGTLVVLCSLAKAQEPSPTKAHRNFPVIITLQFQNLSLPFKDVKGNFNNLGLGVGTEISYNGKNNRVQQLNAVWYHNKNMGNGIMIFTQPAWRPHLGGGMYSEVKLGVGYLYAFRPTKSFEIKNGKWSSAGYKGKGMLVIPIGLTIGYNKFSSRTYFSPFASYQLMIVNGYSKSIPIVPQTFIQIGSRIHFTYK